ncbi:MAG: hypothetical protein NXH88_07220 [Hyphomonas sp.]|nr:hypothetical protein [Hyphomonas sp.]
MTLQAAYTDAELTTPAANPVIADSAGYYTAYLQPLLAYDIEIKSADDATTYASYSRASGAGAETTDSYIIVDTLTELQSLTGDDAEDAVFCLGRTSAGDGYSGLFRWVSSDVSALVTVDTDKAVYVAPSSDTTGASGAWVRVVDKAEYSIMWWDVDPTGVTTGQNAKFLLALELIEDLGGGDLIVHGVGTDNTFLFNGSCQKTSFSEEIRIIGRGLPVLKAGTGQNVPVLDLLASNASPDEPIDVGIHIEGLKIDCSAGSSTGATQECTAIALTAFKRVRVSQNVLYGGTDPTNSNADSGLTTVNCGPGLVDKNYIQGFNDAGVYPGGNNTVGSGGDGDLLTLVDNHFCFCNQAIAPKREMSRIHVQGGIIELCVGGIVSSEVSSVYIGPAQWIHVEGVTFKKCTANMVRFRGPTKGLVHDCLFEDWGLTDLVNETTSAGANALAIVFQGTTDTHLWNNSYRLKDWALDQQKAYSFDNVTLDSVVYTHGNCRFVNEVYEGIGDVWTFAAAGDAHYFNDIHVDTVTTPFPTSNVNAATLVTYTTAGTAEKSGYLGTIPLIFGPTGTWQLLASSGAAASHTGDTTETTLATITIPAGLMGENGICRITTMWTMSSNNANAKSCLVRFGGTVVQNVNLANTLTMGIQRTVINRNSESSQVASSPATTGNSFSTSGGALATAAVDTSTDTDITITCALGNSGDTITLEGYMVEVQHRA